jgi:stage II sporulation protein D
VVKTDLARVLGLNGPVAIQVTRRTPAGRVAELRLGGRRWSAADFETAVKQGLGGSVLKSNMYEVADQGAGLVFRGWGAGHGVGLCQAGASERGRQGQNYRQILAFYFPGTLVGVNAQGLAWTRMGGERVEVWSTRPQQDARLVELADRALAEAERRTGYAARGRPRIRVYPTVAVFRDATGEPGTVAASTLGGTVRLQPAALLGDKLKATLLHEMLHVVVEERAHTKTPVWFREGLVRFLAEGADGRVGVMVRRHGPEAVMRWLEQGLPP